jgi:carbonic anhydrase/acetyltransferase-like protein (isoleucine patch superfamily)
MPLVIPHHGKQPVIPETAYLAPTATVIGDVILGEHSSLWFNVVVRGDVNYIRLGDRTNIQDNRVLIGMGAAIMDDVEVGEECIVGAGSLLTPGTRVPPRSLVVGHPARVVRSVTDDEVENLILFGVRNYIEYKETYRRESGGDA